ncbi:MAG: hypothetical protein WC479_09360 [Candidatus Izemoplasmatales bacterium]
MPDEELIEHVYRFKAIDQMVAAPDRIEIEVSDIKSLSIEYLARYVRKALHIGRFQDFRLQPGSGRHQMEVEWAYQVHRVTGKPVLIIAPLVIQHFVKKIADDAGIEVAFPKIHEELIDGINIINYEKLKKFDPSTFIGVASDVTGLLSMSVKKSKAGKLFPFLTKPTYHMLTATGHSHAIKILMAYVEMCGRQDAGV